MNCVFSPFLCKYQSYSSHLKFYMSNFDFTKYGCRKIALKFAYFGWNYDGLVVQSHTENNTVEEKLFTALEKTKLIENRENCQFTRSGRTDKGVSAFKQMLNGVLPNDVRILAWAPVHSVPDFSARFHCSSRTYKYFLPMTGLSIEPIKEACHFLIGEHDFRNFCRLDNKKWQEMRYVRTIIDITLESMIATNSQAEFDIFELTVIGRGFLWHQIRCIVSVLIEIGKENESPSIIHELLDVAKNTRRPQYEIAREFPLCFFDCNFGKIPLEWQWDKKTLAKTVHIFQKYWTEMQCRAAMIQKMLNELKAILGDDYSNSGISNSLKGETMTKKVYTPLMKRPKCDGLEEKIEKSIAKRLKMNFR